MTPEGKRWIGFLVVLGVISSIPLLMMLARASWRGKFWGLVYLAMIGSVLTLKFVYENRAYRRKMEAQKLVDQLKDSERRYLHQHRN